MTAEGWKRRVVTRRPGEAIDIDGPSKVTVEEIPDNRVRLAVEAAPETRITRVNRRG